VAEQAAVNRRVGGSKPSSGAIWSSFTSEADLKFLAVSTRLSPEVCEYPDTGRFGLLAEMPGAADGKPRELRFMGRAGASLEYWQGE
jgi:uncharacterized cupin superfamily protein